MTTTQTDRTDQFFQALAGLQLPQGAYYDRPGHWFDANEAARAFAADPDRWGDVDEARWGDVDEDNVPAGNPAWNVYVADGPWWRPLAPRLVTRGDFDRAMSDAMRLADVIDGAGGIDVDVAWNAYAADPDRFHEVTADNPLGDPVLTIVLDDGPWWPTWA